MKIKFMYENNGLLLIFLRLNGIAKIKNAKIKMLRFGAQIAKISNRRKYPLYGSVSSKALRSVNTFKQSVSVLHCPIPYW